MPDWFTHIIIGLIFAEAFDVKKKSIVLLGAILPDIIPKLALLKLILPIPEINYSALAAFHVPFIIFLFTILIAPIFKYNFIKIVLWLNIGTISHFLADATLRHFQGGVALLYPLSLKQYTLNYIWPNESFLIILPALLIYISMVIIKNRTPISRKDE